MTSFILGISEDPVAILLMINVMLLCLGMIMDMVALMLALYTHLSATGNVHRY